mmetsp:Transcript_4980/g.15967  ORF Transcript_4980/g.15967 Transcript_4980/m.15967 type:complete len:352 (-) Transcript_4980:823-1878(-)
MENPSAVFKAATIVLTASIPPARCSSSSCGCCGGTFSAGVFAGAASSSASSFSSSSPSVPFASTFSESPTFPSSSSASSSIPSKRSGVFFSSPSSSSSGSGVGSISFNLASYSRKLSANAAVGSSGANGLNPNIVPIKFIAAFRTKPPLSFNLPMAKSHTINQCDNGIAFCSAICAHVFKTLARVNAETSCTRSTNASKKPCFARNSGADWSTTVASFTAPTSLCAINNRPKTDTTADRSEYASPSKCAINKDTFRIVVFGMRLAISSKKFPTFLTPAASVNCLLLYSLGSTPPTSLNIAAAKRASSYRSAASPHKSAIAVDKWSCLFKTCNSAVTTSSNAPHLLATDPTI